jgi:3',5'-cyclic AMP phosphodiesterase CpdA
MRHSDSRARAGRARIFILVLFLSFFFTGLAQKASFADFKFAVAGDSRGDENGINEPVLRKVLSGAAGSGARFLVFVGDMITGSRDNHEHRKRLFRWRSIAEEYDIPVYVVTGNHEIEDGNSEGFIREAFDMPLNGPPEAKELVYYFDYGNARFIVLDTDRYKNFHRVDNEQAGWLDGILNSGGHRLVFVFGHEPAFPVSAHIKGSLDRYADSRDRLSDIFKKGGVSAYSCGH